MHEGRRNIFYPQQDLLAKQSALIAEKVIGITKGDDVMVNLQKFFPCDLPLQSFSSELQKVGVIHIGTLCEGKDGDTTSMKSVTTRLIR